MKIPPYIREIRIPGVEGKEPIFPAYPESPSLGAINIFCGPNNSGKSYILKAISAILGGKQAAKIYQGCSVSINDKQDNIKIFSSGPHWKRKDTIGIISKRYERIDPNKKADFRNFSLLFFFENFDESEQKEISKILDAIEDDESKVYPCNSQHPITSLIEEMLNAQLLYRKTKGNIEFILLNETGLMVPYPEWSDGQKSLFYFILCIKYWKPNILFVDELENHLHPFLMSKILSFIKENVPQTFIATHHPHIIFSDYVDQAFYIETSEKKKSHYIGNYIKVQQQGAPKRKIETLRNAFGKLSAIYKLFDVQDRQLLKQATQIVHDADIIFYRELLDIFYPGVVSSSGKVLPDRQTLDISSMVKSSTNKEKVTILDYGAGVGRVVREFEKLGLCRTKKVEWICWEPSLDRRSNLKKTLSKSKFDYSVPESLNDIEDSSCDLVIAANVVHELTPVEFAELLLKISKVLSIPNGALLMLELHPLLHPEKYAVPYPCSVMSELLCEINFSCYHRSFNVRDAEAYCISATPINQIDKDNQKIQEIIEKYWDRIKIQALSRYHARRGVDDYFDYRNLLMDLNTISSVEAWKAGFWKKYIYA